MNQPDDELQKNTCVEKLSTRNISAEQLRLWLGDRRQRLHDERLRLLKTADTLKTEIATINAMLAELTTG